MSCSRAAAVLLLASAGACVRDTGAATLAARDDRVVTVQATGRGEIAFVVAARMTEGARHVVVLDASPPHVKVFGHDGHLQAAFVRNGGGPGELRAPAALATSGDTAILVVDAKGGLSVFDLAGRLKQHTRPLGIVPLAAAAGCDGGWVLYGPAAGAATPAWLHDVRLAGGGASVRSALSDTLPAQGIGIGLAYGLVGDGRRSLVLRHDAGSAVYTRRCGAATPSLVFHTREARPAREIRQGQGRQVTRAGAGTRALAGMAEVAGGVVLADVFAGGGTELVLHRRGGTVSRRLAGAWFLRDSGPDGVLVSTDDPEPRLYVLRPAAFQKLFASR